MKNEVVELEMQLIEILQTLETAKDDPRQNMIGRIGKHILPAFGQAITVEDKRRSDKAEVIMAISRLTNIIFAITLCTYIRPDKFRESMPVMISAHTEDLINTLRSLEKDILKEQYASPTDPIS